MYVRAWMILKGHISVFEIDLLLLHFSPDQFAKPQTSTSHDETFFGEIWFEYVN